MMTNSHHKAMEENVLWAEWDPRFNSTLLAWPHAATDWATMLEEIEGCYLEIVRALVRAQMKPFILTPVPDELREKLADLAAEVLIVKYKTNDTWTRDFGPLTVGNHCCDFAFNGWGLKFAADRDNLANRQLFFGPADFQASFPLENHLDFVLEGGAIESDGQGLILTTAHCLLSPNRNGLQTLPQAAQELHRRLGARKVIFLQHGSLIGDDTDGHIDTLARLCNPNTIAYVKSYRPLDPHTSELEKMERELQQASSLSGQPFGLFPLPLPDPIFDEDGQRLPATYANFLITPRAILMPIYGQPDNDRQAEQTLQQIFPTREILTVDCRPLLRQHGSLHCATMQLCGDKV